MRLLSKVIFLYFCFDSLLKAEEIIVFKTRSMPIIDNIVSGFQSECTSKHVISIYDMQGNQHKGKEIVSQIKNKIKNQKIKTIFSIGSPATQLLKQSITEVPIFFTMVSNPKKNGFSSPKFSGISKALPAEKQLQLVVKVLPNVRQVAIIYSHNISNKNIEQYTEAATKYALILNQYQVNSVKQTPKILRQVIAENDALILLPDRLVINRSSIEYLITTILENGFPTLSYNEYLVKLGILMGLSPDYAAMGRQAGKLLCNNKQYVPIIHQQIHFKLSVNSKTASTIRTKPSAELMDLADHVY